LKTDYKIKTKFQLINQEFFEKSDGLVSSMIIQQKRNVELKEAMVDLTIKTELARHQSAANDQNDLNNN
jgi:hypothetical protein